MADAPDQSFAALAARFLGEPDVVEGTGFGKTPGLRTGGKIFAMLMHGRLVVKLPRERVDALVATGSSAPFSAGHGRVMKEWASVDVDARASWEALATEARDFVRAGGTTAGARR